ncbi:MAG: hypothetical protein GF309_15195 [Candidatus Lokiarchaeota archaeon]|nr:hypothetical protein [Candidatus Lokiarchaeota archaeon]
MIRKRTVFPSAAEVNSGEVTDPNEIYVKSVLSKGKEDRTGILIESVWGVEYETKTVRFVRGNLITRFTKLPITSSDVPDRHLRSASKVARAIFDLERFNGLVLTEDPDLSTVYRAERDSHSEVFTSKQDARIWCSLIDADDTRIVPVQPSEAPLAKARKNSEDVQNIVLRLLYQALAGLEALDTLHSMRRRGTGSAELEAIWERVFNKRQFPDKLAEVLHQGQQ